ncbi:flagellar basal body-associated FliL family protein [Bacteriovoracaceae bacterium]|nr:flagellar basal body-associated FliL family protein [Bacteriovoracaceae bacterium]
MTGNKTLDKALIIFNLLGCLLGVGTFLFTGFISQRDLPDDHEEFMDLLVEGYEESNHDTFKLKKLILNLKSGKSRLRYLNVTMELLPFHESQVSTIDQHAFAIYDNIIDISGRLDPAEINSVTGKIVYEDRIKRSTNKIIGRPVVKKIYFTRFIIQ